MMVSHDAAALPRVDAVVRRASNWGDPWGLVAPGELAELAAARRDPLAFSAVAGMRRSGHLREAAVPLIEAWAESQPALAWRLLLLRAADPVPQGREAARAALGRLFHVVPVTDVVTALPLLDRLGSPGAPVGERLVERHADALVDGLEARNELRYSSARTASSILSSSKPRQVVPPPCAP